MNLIKDGLQNKTVIRTSLTRKLTIDGMTNPYPVYKIRLDQLFYNDQNDRIATWISEYRVQHDGQMPDMNDQEVYNSIIEQFIVESNPDAIRKTQNNIELVDQREPGIVLADGRIIDGNRRFTCLRKLAPKGERFAYFEAVILDRDIERSAKAIKMLELAIQHGEESKVDYNPIDRLVGVYNDLIETKLLSEEEYARATNESLSDVRKRMELARLMIEFLAFIHAPKQFFIARDMQIYSPLNELSLMLKKCSSAEEAEKVKTAVFSNILMQTSTDLVRYIRNFKSIIGSDYEDEFLKEQCAVADKVIGAIPHVEQMDTAVVRDMIRTNDELAEELDNSVEKTLLKIRKTETRNRPIQQAEKATAFLEDIDVHIIDKMNDSELRRFARQLNKLKGLVAELEGKLQI